MASSNTILTRKDSVLIRELDKKCKASWNFDWLQLTYKVAVPGKGSTNFSFKDCFQKIDLPGKALCTYCGDKVNYGGRGRSHLINHVETKKDKDRLRDQLTNQSLPSCLQAQPKEKKFFSIFKNIPGPSTSSSSGPSTASSSGQDLPSDTSTREVFRPVVPLVDRISNMEAMIVSFMAENTLPFAIAPKLVSLLREYAKDPPALAKLDLGKTSATYKLKYGVEASIKDALVNEFRRNPFSLNVDEATSSSNKKVLTVLVNHFSGGLGRIATNHLASIELIKVTSESVYNAICELFEKHSLPWTNLISVLFDSCAVMCGCKNGVEMRLWTEKAPHLLEIEGDSCHHIHNVCKKFCSAFGGHLESLFSDFAVDFKYCTEHKALLQEMCELLKIPYSAPKSYGATRWLSVYDCAVDYLRMFDALFIFYFSFLTSSTDKDAYRGLVRSILQRRMVSHHSKLRIQEISETLSKKHLTKDGKERKRRIVKKVLFSEEKTTWQLQFFTSVLPVMKKYVCFFQTSIPQANKLHEFQETIIRHFLSFFIKPEVLQASVTGKKLLSLNIKDEKFHLPANLMFTGDIKASTPAADEWKHFQAQYLSAYKEGANEMLKKLPVDSRHLKGLSALEPVVISHTVVMKHLLNLTTDLEHLNSEEEKREVKAEVREYCNQVMGLPEFKDGMRVDVWWGKVENFPLLSKLAKAGFTCFHGAVVESSFSAMNRVINNYTNCMDLSTCSAIQTVKYYLKCEGKTSVQLFRKQSKREPVDATLCSNMNNSWRMYDKEMKAKRREKLHKVEAEKTKADKDKLNFD